MTGAFDASSAVLWLLAVAHSSGLLSFRVSLIAVGIAGFGSQFLSAICCIPRKELVDEHSRHMRRDEALVNFESSSASSRPNTPTVGSEIRCDSGDCTQVRMIEY